jgi:capsular polysaccharide biosynthesis protein
MVMLAVREGATTDEQLRQTSTLPPDAATCAVLAAHGVQRPGLAAKVVGTNVSPKTAVIDVAATDESPAQARLLANTLATEVVNYAWAVERPIEDRQEVHTRVVSAASGAREQRFERILLGVLAAVAALVLGGVAV